MNAMVEASSLALALSSGAVKVTPLLYLAISGRTLEFDGKGKCVSGRS